MAVDVQREREKDVAGTIRLIVNASETLKTKIFFAFTKGLL